MRVEKVTLYTKDGNIRYISVTDDIEVVKKKKRWFDQPPSQERKQTMKVKDAD